MLLRLSPGAVLRGLRNEPYTPGRDLRFPYAIELDATDYPLGTTITAATLIIAQDFGLNPLVSKQITTVLSAAGQITNAAVTGIGALYFAVAAGELSSYRTLGPLVFEVIVTDSRGLQASLDIGSLYPTPSTAGAPVDHVLVTPNPFTLGFPATQQLVATAYDADSNILAGRSVQWATSDPTIATVDANGVVSVLAAGAVLITATIEGHAAQSTGTITVPPNIQAIAALDFCPLVRRADLAQPLAGIPTGRLQHTGSGTMGVARVVYPKSATEWGMVAAMSNPGMRSDMDPDSHFATKTQLLNQGPYPGETTAWKIEPNDAGGHWCRTLFDWRDPDATRDAQDIAIYKRSMALQIKAATGADVGKTVRINALDRSHDFSGTFGGWWYGAGTTPLKFVDVVLTANFQAVQITFDSRAQFAGITPDLFITMPAINAPLASYIFAAYGSWAWQAEENDPSNWFRPFPFHETLGVLSQYQSQNSWKGGRDPILINTSGNAAKVVTAIAAPDSIRYYGGTFYTELTLDPGDGITTNLAYRIEDPTDSYPSNVPASAGWLHIGPIKAGAGAIPVNGALVGYLKHLASGTEYGPFPCNLDSWVDTVLGRFFRCRVPINLASEGYLDFQGRIINASAGRLKFNFVEAAMTSEGSRAPGLHGALVPKPALTAPIYNDAAWEQIPSSFADLSVMRGTWIQQLILPYSLSGLANLNGVPSQTCLEQTGPNGSADDSFNCDVSAGTGDTIDILISMSRGAPTANPQDYRSWHVNVRGIPRDEINHFPAMVPFTIALSWEPDPIDATKVKIIAFGIGHGPGLGMTWLNDGDTFLGGTVSITSVGGLAWELNQDTDSHMGVAADRDVIREVMGFIQVLYGTKVDVDAGTIQASIEYYLFNRPGPRIDRRAA